MEFLLMAFKPPWMPRTATCTVEGSKQQAGCL
jgi:hypothetical protein